MKNKYVWTFWTLPYRLSTNSRDLLINTIYLLYSIELVNLIPNTELIVYTDEFGEEFLKKFNIRSDIIISKKINNLTEKDIYKWAYPKIITMDSISAPFYHIDHDVFLFKEQPKKNVPITGELFELHLNNRKLYKTLLDFLNENNPNFLPSNLQKYTTLDKIGGVKCGYLHVQCDINKFQWTSLAESLFKKNYDITTKTVTLNKPKFIHNHLDLANSSVNVISEQFTLYYLNLVNKNKIVDTLFSNDCYINGVKAPYYTHLEFSVKKSVSDKFLESSEFMGIICNLEKLNNKSFKEIIKYIQIG